MEEAVKVRFPCKDCKKTFSHKNALKRHRTSYAHTSGIPCNICSKPFSRTDDLSLHLQRQHKLSFKDAGRKAGSSRRKAKRSAAKESEDDRMAAAIEHAFLSPAKKAKTGLITATATRPENEASTSTPEVSEVINEVITPDADKIADPSKIFPVTFDIIKSLSLEAIGKHDNATATGLGTILSIQDIALELPPTDSLNPGLPIVYDLPVFDLSEWEKLEKYLEEQSKNATSEAKIDNLSIPLEKQPTGEASIPQDLGTDAVISDDLISKPTKETNFPPSSLSPLPPHSPTQIGEDSDHNSPSPIPSSIADQIIEDKGPEPSTSSNIPITEKRGIPSVWLQVEELWLNLYMNNEPAALTTALDFVNQLQSQAQ
jgi:hypothetical protein